MGSRRVKSRQKQIERGNGNSRKVCLLDSNNIVENFKRSEWIKSHYILEGVFEKTCEMFIFVAMLMNNGKIFM